LVDTLYSTDTITQVVHDTATVYHTDTIVQYLRDTIVRYIADTVYISPIPINISVSGASLFPSLFNLNNPEYMINRDLNTTQPTVITITIGDRSYDVTIPSNAATAVIGEGYKAVMQSYPTITDGHLTINTNQWQAGDKIEIYNVSGVLVGAFDIADDTTTVSIAHLPAGAYIVKVGSNAAKVVKQ
jgi:hypothetical protein